MKGPEVVDEDGIIDYDSTAASSYDKLSFPQGPKVAFPREWEELMLPDKADIMKEKWKYVWRRTIFYVYFFTLLIYVQHFPSTLQTTYVCAWILLILWFEVDVTSEKNNYLIRLFHGLCFVSAFLNAAFIICLLILDTDWITKISGDLNKNVAFTWVIVVWMNFLPPFWVVIDLYLHRGDLIERHNLIIPPNWPTQFFRVSLQIFWIITCLPIVIAIWALSGASDPSIANLDKKSFYVIVPVFLLLTLFIASIFILFLRKRRIERLQRLISSNDYQEYGRTVN